MTRKSLMILFKHTNFRLKRTLEVFKENHLENAKKKNGLKKQIKQLDKEISKLLRENVKDFKTANNVLKVTPDQNQSMQAKFYVKAAMDGFSATSQKCNFIKRQEIRKQQKNVRILPALMADY